MTTEQGTRRVLPNFKAMTEHELYGFAQSEHEMAPVADYILELRSAAKGIPMIDAGGPVRITELLESEPLRTNAIGDAGQNRGLL